MDGQEVEGQVVTVRRAKTNKGGGLRSNNYNGGGDRYNNDRYNGGGDRRGGYDDSRGGGDYEGGRSSGRYGSSSYGE
jgi:hypothetical protein